MNSAEIYFNTCKNYWISKGDPEPVATSKAFWWDCIEVWNADKSWNVYKQRFAYVFRGYKPGDPVPDADMVSKGGC